MFVVKYYAQSLHYGSKYVYQSLPRLLSIWFDHASVTSRNGGNNNGTAGRSSSSTSPQNRSSTMSQMQQCIRKILFTFDIIAEKITQNCNFICRKTYARSPDVRPPNSIFANYFKGVP